MEKSQTNSPQLNSLRKFEYQKTAVYAGNFPPGEMIAIRPVCENLGIDRRWQQQKIQSDSGLSQLGGMYKSTGSDGKAYEMYCLPPDAFQEWLWKLGPMDNMNVALYEDYKKGLVVHLLLMLKISLDEIKRLRGVEQEFMYLREEVREMIESDDAGKKYNKMAKEHFYNKMAKEHFKSMQSLKQKITARISKDPDQLQIDF